MDVVNKRKSNTNCCVYGCRSVLRNDSDLSFHRFPQKGKYKVTISTRAGVTQNVDLFYAWEYAIKSGKSITKYMRVCSKHFKDNDYSDQKIRRRLKRNAVPSLNLPKPLNKEKLTRKHPSTKSEMETLFFEEPELLTPTPDELTAAETLLQLQLVECTATTSTPVDKATQVGSGDTRIQFSAKLNTEKKLNTATGLPSFKILDTITSLVDEQCHWKAGSSGLTVRDKIILTLMKIKQDVSYAMLSVLFDITATSCRNIFFKYNKILSSILKNAILWPTKEQILKNVPICFKDFLNVRVVLDCTEIGVQTPKCLCCKIRTYSHYKSKHTVKFLTGVAPSGLITFISKAYGGRASDKAIFEQSNIIEEMEPFEDAVMVDKGFRIDDITNHHNIGLIRPPFLTNNKQMSAYEALLNNKIAKARIKQFKILSNKLPWNMACIFDDIFTVVCGIVNMSAPIIGPEGFHLAASAEED